MVRTINHLGRSWTKAYEQKKCCPKLGRVAYYTLVRSAGSPVSMFVASKITLPATAFFFKALSHILRYVICTTDRTRTFIVGTPAMSGGKFTTCTCPSLHPETISLPSQNHPNHHRHRRPPQKKKGGEQAMHGVMSDGRVTDGVGWPSVGRSVGRSMDRSLGQNAAELLEYRQVS